MGVRRIEDLLAGLNTEQRRAVRTTEGPLLVLAGAGTGKTRVVTVRIAHLLAAGVDARHILAVTFTNKAAREMKERVTATVGRKPARGLTIATFHSFALRLLRQDGERLGYRSDFTIADEEDRLTLLRTTLREMGIGEKQVAPRWGIAQISAWKNDGLDPDGAADVATEERELLLTHAWEALDRELKRRQAVDFDDMILLAGRLLRDFPDVLDASRDRYRYLMIDEYQDTNGAQYELIRLLAGARRNLCVVGDDDQSIYGWRGARPGNILDFSRHYPGAATVALTQNYRSTNKILRAANGVIGHNAGRHAKELWSALGDGEDITFFRAADEREELINLTARIGALRRRGVKWEAIAVLFRANAQSGAIELALRERQIPYRVVGTRSLFDRRECRDLLAYLRVLGNPRDDGALLRVINTPPRGIGRGTQDKLMEEAVRRRCGLFEVIRSGEADAALGPAARRAVTAFRELMADVESVLGDDGVGRALETLFERIGYRAFLETESRDALDAQVRSNVIDQLLELARDFASRHPGAGATELLDTLSLDPRPDRAGEEDGFGITLLTVHAAKGLEFDHLFLLGVEEGLFPHKNSFETEDGTDTIDEERRLFYVALTRARRELYLSMASTRRRWGRDEEREESRFVSEMGEEGISFVDAASQGPADEATAGDYLSRLKGLVAGGEGE